MLCCGNSPYYMSLNVIEMTVLSCFRPKHYPHKGKAGDINKYSQLSKSKGHPEAIRDIRTSTYQICRIEENTNRKTKFHKKIYYLTPLARNIYRNYCGERRNCSSEAISPLIYNILLLILDLCVQTRTRFSFRDKRLFEIIEVEITRVDITYIGYSVMHKTRRIYII